MSATSAGPSARTVLRVGGIVVASVIALYLVYRLRKPITWIVIGGFIAIALSAPVTVVQRRVRRRGLAIFIVYLGVICVPVLIGAVLVPPLVKETNRLVDKVPDYATDVQRYVRDNRQLRKLEQDYNLTGKLQEQAAKLPGKLGGAAGVLSDIGLGLVNSLFATITILILSIFMISSGGGWVEAAIRSSPPVHQPVLRRAATDISSAVGGYCAGAIAQGTIA